VIGRYYHHALGGERIMTIAEKRYMGWAAKEVGDEPFESLTKLQAQFLYCLMRRLYDERRWELDEMRDTAQRLDALIVDRLRSTKGDTP
jgi:hypothetical protein